MKRTVFLTGTDTDVGKTYVGCLLLQAARRRHVSAGAYKPVASGFADDAGSDGDRLWRAAGGIDSLDAVSPQRFVAPYAPAVSAAMEGKRVDESRIISGWKEQRQKHDLLLVEGAGGLFSPITDRWSNADLIKELDAKAVLIAGWKLGVVHQVLCCLVAARAVGIAIECIVLSEFQKQCRDAAQSHWDLLVKTMTQTEIGHGIPIRPVPFGEVEWRYELP